jgi:hypothetical protein
VSIKHDTMSTHAPYQLVTSASHTIGPTSLFAYYTVLYCALDMKLARFIINSTI